MDARSKKVSEWRQADAHAFCLGMFPSWGVRGFRWRLRLLAVSDHCKHLESQLDVKRSHSGVCCDSVMVEVLILNAPLSHMGVGSNPDSSSSHPAPCLWCGKAIEEGPMALGPCTHVGYLEEVPGSRSAQHRLSRSLGE